MAENEVLLSEGVRAKIHQIVGVVEGKENRRVTVRLISDQPDENRIIKDYYVWIDPECAIKQGYTALDEPTTIKIALDAVQRQFEVNQKVIPIEDGLYLSNNEEIIVDPQSFRHPLELTQNE